MTKYPKIEGKLGLHQELNIWCVVDGYEANLVNENGYENRPEWSARGETIDQALDRLEAMIN